jgi:hypothetical protein
MTMVVPIQLPRLHKVVGALAWELAWKNRLVLPVLLVALVLGGGLASSVTQAPPDVWWANYARGTAFIAFLASLLLAFAPFTLMDSHGSWRMNSVTTRWSVLPARTLCLVIVPLVLAWAVITVLVSAWSPILARLFQGIDMIYILAVFLTGAAAVQALAWAIPRKPSQFWVAAGLLFLSLVLGSVAPQDGRDWPDLRGRVMTTLAGVCVVLTLLAVLAARRNRCGDWSGETPLARLSGFLRFSSTRAGVFRKPLASLFWSEVLPSCRTFMLSWVVLTLLLAGLVCVNLWLRGAGNRINWLPIAIGMVVEPLPNFGVVWLMAWGLFVGCEPGMGFQTRLSGYRSTRPLTVGMLAGTRMSGLGLIWLCVWAPLLVVQSLLVYAPIPEREAMMFSRMAADLMAGRMAFSANILVAALPVLLWGRLEGFPTVFLATILAWCWSCVLGTFAYQKEPLEWVVWALGALLAMKLVAASWLMFRAYQQGQVTWRFPVVLVSSWIAVVGGMFWLFRPWQESGLTSALAPVVMIPLVRLAACPLALAANRHR